MRIFFISLATLTVLLLSGAFFFAWAEPERLWHFYCGLVGTIFCLVTHCWIFFYFIGTGEGIREGILEAGLDLKPIRTTKKFKGRVFPFALFAMIFMIVAAIYGGALRAGQASAEIHRNWTIFAFLFNLLAFKKELAVLTENENLMQKLNDEILVNENAITPSHET